MSPGRTPRASTSKFCLYTVLVPLCQTRLLSFSDPGHSHSNIVCFCLSSATFTCEMHENKYDGVKNHPQRRENSRVQDFSHRVSQTAFPLLSMTLISEVTERVCSNMFTGTSNNQITSAVTPRST